MKKLNTFIVERLIINKTKQRNNVFSKFDFLGKIHLEQITDEQSEFSDDHFNEFIYFDVIGENGNVIGIVEQNSKSYFNLIVSPQTFERIMNAKYPENEGDDYWDLPKDIYNKICNDYFKHKFVHGAGITIPKQFAKDKNQYTPKVFNNPKFQELLNYITETLE